MSATKDNLINFKLGHINIGKRTIILEEPISLELSKADYGGYLLTNNDFGILTIGNSLEEMIKDINEQFTVLWNEYVRSDDELSTSGQMLKDKILDRLGMHGYAIEDGKREAVRGCKPMIVIEGTEDMRYYRGSGGEL